MNGILKLQYEQRVVPLNEPYVLVQCLSGTRKEASGKSLVWDVDGLKVRDSLRELVFRW